MSANVDEEEYTNNIDDQLLNAAKQEGVVTQGDLEVTRAKLEQIAHAAALSDRPQNLGLQPGSSEGNHLKEASKHLESAGRVPPHNINKQYHHQSANHQHPLQGEHLHYGDDVDDSEYNIQIPEPIIDSKLRIYPVTENTITAEGNLITRPYPEQVFHHREDLNEFILEFARDNGFGVVIAHSNKKAIYYTCELGGRYRHKKSRKEDEDENKDNAYLLDPNAKTKKLKCPFSMTASYKKSTSVWTLRTTCNEHNHPQLDPLLNHPMLRKRSDELNLLILDLYKVGTKPSHIESKIKDQYPDVLIKREDIYNEIRGYKRKIKKQTSRYPTHIQRLALLRKRAVANNDVDAEAAVAAAAFLNGSNDDEDVADSQNPDAQVLQYEIQHQHNQQQQEEFQRQFNQAAVEVAAHQQHLDDHHYQQYQQHLQEHGLQDNDSTAAAAIAAVANVARQHHGHHHHHRNDSGELSMDNIDSRLVGE